MMLRASCTNSSVNKTHFKAATTDKSRFQPLFFIYMLSSEQFVLRPWSLLTLFKAAPTLVYHWCLVLFPDGAESPSSLCSVSGCFFSPDSEVSYHQDGSHVPRPSVHHLISKAVAQHAFALSACAQEDGRKRSRWRKTLYINDDSAMHRELYGRRPQSSEAGGGTTSQLALLSDSLFFQGSLSLHCALWRRGQKSQALYTSAQSFHKSRCPQTEGQNDSLSFQRKYKSWCSHRGTLASCHIMLHCLQISCLPEVERLESYQVILFFTKEDITFLSKTCRLSTCTSQCTLDWLLYLKECMSMLSSRCLISEVILSLWE